MTKFLKYTLIAAILVFATAFSTMLNEKKYPQDYFRSPVAHPMRLSGSFGELRPNHFHSGIDIKPTEGIGERLYAVADGYVSRINISSGGYGKAIYIDHPNGYTSVYAHLYRFTDSVAAYIREQQYAKEQFAMQIYPDSGRLAFKQGEVIGYLGTSGRSFGAHLHFEIRDTKSEHPINPLLFGLQVKDDVLPIFQQLKLYHLDKNRRSLYEQTYRTVESGRNYKLSKDTLIAGTGQLGLGVQVYDKMTGVSNRNGISELLVYQDDSLIYHFDIERFSFDETRYLNAHIDYPTYQKNKNRFQRCFLLPGNRLSAYQPTAQDGIVMLDANANQASNIEIIARDAHGNNRSLSFAVRRGKVKMPNKKALFNYILPYNEPSIVRQEGMELRFKAYTFYEDLLFYCTAEVDTSEGIYSSVYHLGKPTIPVHYAFDLGIRPQRLPKRLRDKALIARCDGTAPLRSMGGEWDGEQLKASVKTFGDFCIVVDTLPPTIRAIRVNSRMPKNYKMSFRITDDLSGIADYRATVDGEWIVMDYDAKNDLLTHRFEGGLAKGQHQLTLTVTDGRGNVKTYERTFSN